MDPEDRRIYIQFLLYFILPLGLVIILGIVLANIFSVGSVSDGSGPLSLEGGGEAIQQPGSSTEEQTEEDMIQQLEQQYNEAFPTDVPEPTPTTQSAHESGNFDGIFSQNILVISGGSCFLVLVLLLAGAGAVVFIMPAKPETQEAAILEDTIPPEETPAPDPDSDSEEENE